VDPSAAERRSETQESHAVQFVGYLSLFSAGFVASYVFGEPVVRRLERSRPAALLLQVARSLVGRSR
jgi:hypothetical protein